MCSCSKPSWPDRRPGLLARRAFVGAVVAGIVIAAVPARAQTEMPLGSGDFTLDLSRVDSSGHFTLLGEDERNAFFSAARCACPASYGVTLALTDGGLAKLVAGDRLDATVMIGSDCDNVAATACPSLGSSLTLNGGQTSTGETLSTSDVFSALAPGASCAALPSTSSRIWAIVRLNGTRLDTQPSLTISLGGARPTSPTAVAALTADSGLLVSWTAPATTAAIQGYQVFCSPGPSSPSAAAFDSCPAAPPTGDTGPFASLDPMNICSGLVGVGTNSVRVHGLQNGSAYQVAVISIGIDGTPSAPSVIAAATPGPTLGFSDVYKDAGGNGLAGCAVGGSQAGGRGPLGIGAGLVLASILVGRRRGRRRRCGARRSALPVSLGLALLVGLSSTSAAADDDRPVTGWRPTAAGLALGDEAPLSPSAWNVELRFGPYYPDVDSELADRGLPGRPFEEVFSSKKRLMSGLEIDRQLSHRGGIWAIGFGVGYYNATASALAADHVTRSGDQTSLRIVPLSIAAVYRADQLRTRLGSPLVPYAKLGLDMGLWSVGGTAPGASASGQTLGWHAAAGVSLDLSFIDPGGAHTMDMETGVNQVAIFFEVTHAALDGFGSSSVLRVGDTTWLGGLMLEM